MFRKAWHGYCAYRAFMTCGNTQLTWCHLNLRGAGLQTDVVLPYLASNLSSGTLNTHFQRAYVVYFVIRVVGKRGRYQRNLISLPVHIDNCATDYTNAAQRICAEICKFVPWHQIYCTAITVDAHGVPINWSLTCRITS